MAAFCPSHLRKRLGRLLTFLDCLTVRRCS